MEKSEMFHLGPKDFDSKKKKELKVQNILILKKKLKVQKILILKKKKK